MSVGRRAFDQRAQATREYAAFLRLGGLYWREIGARLGVTKNQARVVANAGLDEMRRSLQRTIKRLRFTIDDGIDPNDDDAGYVSAARGFLNQSGRE